MASRKAGLIAGLAVAGLAAAGLITSTVANADSTAAPSSNPTASAPAQAEGACDPGGRGGPEGRGGAGASQDTPVTGDEAQKVIDAVQAKDAGVTIDTVRKDPDGSYDALGSRADGTKVMYDVSTDLATITENAGKGAPGGRQHNEDAEG